MTLTVTWGWLGSLAVTAMTPLFDLPAYTVAVSLESVPPSADSVTATLRGAPSATLTTTPLSPSASSSAVRVKGAPGCPAEPPLGGCPLL